MIQKGGWLLSLKPNKSLVPQVDITRHLHLVFVQTYYIVNDCTCSGRNFGMYIIVLNIFHAK